MHSISRSRNTKKENEKEVARERRGSRVCGRRLVTFIKCVSVLFKIKAAEKNALQLQLKSSSKDAATPQQIP